MHISTIEAFPLARADAARALAQFPEAADLAEALLARWPVRAFAPQRLWFEEDGLCLTVFTGEAETILAEMDAQFDAWFLDGFAPARNPAMWSPETARPCRPPERPRRAPRHVHSGRRSAPRAGGGRICCGEDSPASAASASGWRRGSRTPRVFESAAFTRRQQLPRSARPAIRLYPYAACHPKRVAILGAGIAGAACAQALVRRGVETIVLEAAPELGAGRERQSGRVW